MTEHLSGGDFTDRPSNNASDDQKIRLIALLGFLFRDRGMHVDEWPEDEREVYRRDGYTDFSERNQAVREYRISKAAKELLDIGWTYTPTGGETE